MLEKTGPRGDELPITEACKLSLRQHLLETWQRGSSRASWGRPSYQLSWQLAEELEIGQRGLETCPDRGASGSPPGEELACAGASRCWVVCRREKCGPSSQPCLVLPELDEVPGGPSLRAQYCPLSASSPACRCPGSGLIRSPRGVFTRPEFPRLSESSS